VTRAGAGQGSNSANLRHFNERVILTALRRLGQASKADLARTAKLTDNTAGLIVRELQDRRLVRVEGKRLGGRGQPATLLTLDPEGAYAIGVKIGRRSIDGVLVDFCGAVLAHRRQERVFPPPEEALALAVRLVEELTGELPPDRAGRLCGLGLAMPYNMGSWRRELDISESAYAAWNAFDLPARLAAPTRLRIFTENDGTAASIAELFMGQGRELDDFLYVFVGTAVGGGVVLGGNSFRGPSGNAGDIGLMPVGPSRLSTAPRPGHAHDVLLSRASISSLIRHLRANGLAVRNHAELDRAITADAPHLVAQWLDDCADALVAPLLAAARILDVETVVVDGDLPAELIARLVTLLGQRLGEASPEARTAPALRRGLVGRSAAAIGAAILPLHHSFSPTPEVLLGAELTGEPQRVPA
jgi:predicted NBD/HSP70 family sugar kinase